MRNNDEIIRRLFKILCSYKPQPPALMEYLQKWMRGKYYADRFPLFERYATVTDAIFVSDGYVACYDFDANNDPQVIGIYGKDSIIAGKSFTGHLPSDFMWVALPGAYLLKIAYENMTEVYQKFTDAEELARLVMADNNQRDQERLRLLKRDAETVVLDFYVNHMELLLNPNMMTDADLSTFLMIAESTLRAARLKLIREEKLPKIGG